MINIFFSHQVVVSLHTNFILHLDSIAINFLLQNATKAIKLIKIKFDKN